MKPKLVKCKECGRQSFAVKKESLELMVHNLNVMYYRLDPIERRSIFGNVPFSMQEFLQCEKCKSSYENFVGMKEPKSHKNDVGFILDKTQ